MQIGNGTAGSYTGSSPFAINGGTLAFDLASGATSTLSGNLSNTAGAALNLITGNAGTVILTGSDTGRKYGGSEFRNT